MKSKFFTAISLFLVVLLVCLTVVVVYKKINKRGNNLSENSVERTQDSESSSFASGTIKNMVEEWTYAMQGPQGGKDEMDGVSVDTKGNVIIGGPFQNTVDFNGIKRTAKTGIDVYLSKLSPTGEEIWFTTFDSGGNDFMWDLETDKNDDILISGGYGGTLTVNGKTYNANKNGSALFAKIDGDTGNFIWLQTAGVISSGTGIVDSERTAGGNEIKVDSQGNAVAILSARGDSYQIGERTYRPSGVMDSFIVKLSPDGEFLWEYQFLGNGRKQGRAIGVNSKDEIAFGHELNGGIDTKEGIGFSGTNNKIAIGTAGLLTIDGKLKWMIPVVSEGFANVRGAGSDSEDNVYFTGLITGDATIDDVQVTGFKNASAFLAKFTSSGEMEWIRVLDNESEDTGGELIVFGDSIAITGSSMGDNYNLYDHKGNVLTEDVHTSEARKGRATLTIFNTEGAVVARHSPVYSDYSNAGVLEYAQNDCVVYQHTFYGKITYENGDTYTSKNSVDPKTPDKDIGLAKVCLP